jgi:hypothetical protein
VASGSMCRPVTDDCVVMNTEGSDVRENVPLPIL